MRAPNRTDHANIGGPKALACIASTTVAFALSRGLTLDQIEETAGISGIDLMDPDARLPDHVIPKLWCALMECSDPEEALALEMARAAPLSFLGGLAHGAQFAANLREALNLFVQNRSMLADRLEVGLRETGTEASLVATHPLDSLDDGRTAEVGVAVMTRVVREVLDMHQSMTRVEFTHQPRGLPDAYQAFFNIPVLFEQGRNAIVFDASSLSRPIRNRNVDLFAFVQKHYEQVRNRVEREKVPPELSTLRDAIAKNAEHGDFSVTAAAARANLSLRSAQRLASLHQTSLQDLIEDIRLSGAKEILRDPSTTVETVARLVGYTDDRSFRRAFKRRFGETPSQFRMVSVRPLSSRKLRR